jgi:hypothetical protein
MIGPQFTAVRRAWKDLRSEQELAQAQRIARYMDDDNGRGDDETTDLDDE